MLLYQMLKRIDAGLAGWRQIYNSALADSLTQMMRNCFHKSAHRFDKDFHEHIKCQILEWTSGECLEGWRTLESQARFPPWTVHVPVAASAEHPR